MKAEVIIEHMIAGFIALDGSGVVTKVNARFANMVRIPAREIEGRSVFDVIPDLAGSRAEAMIREALDVRTNRRVDMFSPSLYNWFDIIVVPTEPDEVYLFVRDVTDRERAIQTDAMRETLHRILGEAPIAITITAGSEHRIELMNSAARALLGGRDMEGLTMKTALPELDDSFFGMMDHVFQTGEPMTIPNLEATYDREGNGKMYTGRFDVSYQPMRDASGVITGIVSTSVETTTTAI